MVPRGAVLSWANQSLHKFGFETHFGRLPAQILKQRSQPAVRLTGMAVLLFGFCLEQTLRTALEGCGMVVLVDSYFGRDGKLPLSYSLAHFQLLGSMIFVAAVSASSLGLTASGLDPRASSPRMHFLDDFCTHARFSLAEIGHIGSSSDVTFSHLCRFSEKS